MQKVSQKCKEIHFKFGQKHSRFRYLFLLNGHFIKSLRIPASIINAEFVLPNIVKRICYYCKRRVGHILFLGAVSAPEFQ